MLSIIFQDFFIVGTCAFLQNWRYKKIYYPDEELRWIQQECKTTFAPNQKVTIVAHIILKDISVVLFQWYRQVHLTKYKCEIWVVLRAMAMQKTNVSLFLGSWWCILIWRGSECSESKKIRLIEDKKARDITL